MPFYDRACENGHQMIDCLEPVTAPSVSCPTCGEPATRVWLAKAGAVIADEIPGGFTFEHVVPGLKVYSESEKRRVLKEHGYVECVEHKTLRGTDKSKHTSRWTAIPVNEEERLANWHAHEARLQAELAGKQ